MPRDNITLGIALGSVLATVIGVGGALAVLMVTITNDIRAEARADRAAFQEESTRLRAEDRADREETRADREAWQAEMRKLRAEAAGDRETLSRLTGIVEEVRTARR